MPETTRLTAHPWWAALVGALLVVPLVAMNLVVVFALITFELGREIYACDVLGVPNCD